MTTISIWYRSPEGNYEVVDRAGSQQEADYLAGEYTTSFGCGYRQHLWGKGKVWTGRRDAEPEHSPEALEFAKRH